MSNKRHKARQHALQGLYQWQVTGQDIGEIVTQFLVEHDAKNFDSDYFDDLLRGVPKHLDEIDEQLEPLLDRAVEQVDLVERAALRIGVYELRFHQEVPFRVVINEAVELSKKFGSEQGHKYVNGVLDKLLPKLRPHEARKV